MKAYLNCHPGPRWMERGSQKLNGLAVLYKIGLSFPIPMQQYTGNYLLEQECVKDCLFAVYA